MTFAIAVKQDPYQTYILSDDSAQSRVEVVPERGGIVTRWRIQGQDLLYLDTERFADPTKSVRGGIPILFPICGDLPDDTYTLEGKSYQLPRHGFARDLPWSVSDRVTDGHAGLTLVLKSNERTREQYPFDFQVTFAYQLRGKTLTLQQRYSNYSASPMPFSLGLHPYFQVGDKQQLAFDIPAARYFDRANNVGGPFNNSFDFTRNEVDATLTPLARREASFEDRARGIKLTVRYSEECSTLVFWMLQDKPFICLEPWSAPRNALITGEHLLSLEPGASLDTTVELVADTLRKENDDT
ncbi:Galactose mutarotase [Rubidibacter lacunae KORDI 51-2]|uniref:Galactose mutarotase n=1 Tax=Rubidibacter lacunae KORDI 51-2 TaxID=582515 RepID=U5DIZ4_9CHRO|nr:galactose mutarotase [Rubidibacter lacunae]ERN40907.1 Galactose mutarotase [Rubidibacter lacunae KORDI 51-2]